eukprot:14390370-Alexandrium_andersonii.AAC.1
MRCRWYRSPQHGCQRVGEVTGATAALAPSLSALSAAADSGATPRGGRTPHQDYLPQAQHPACPET